MPTETFFCRLRKNTEGIAENKTLRKLQKKPINALRQQQIIELEATRHKKFLKVKGVSAEVAALIWNKKRLVLFLEEQQLRYIINFKRMPVEKSQLFESYEKCVPKQRIFVTYATATEDSIIVGNNYGCLFKIPEELTRKVHAGDIKHITHRKNLLLTCSEDCTSMLLNLQTLETISLLKDDKYMKEVPLQGHFIDDFRVAVCSKIYVKVFGLYDMPQRISNTLLIVEMPTDNPPVFVFQNDIMLHKYQSTIRMILLDKLADIDHAEMVLDMKGIKIDNFCLMSEGRLAVHTQQLLKAIRIADGQMLWSIPLSDINIPSGKIQQMLYCNGHLCLIDGDGNCVRLPIPFILE